MSQMSIQYSRILPGGTGVGSWFEIHGAPGRARISTTVNVYTHAIRAWGRPAADILSTVLAQPDLSRP